VRLLWVNPDFSSHAIFQLKRQILPEKSLFVDSEKPLAERVASLRQRGELLGTPVHKASY